MTYVLGSLLVGIFVDDAGDVAQVVLIRRVNHMRRLFAGSGVLHALEKNFRTAMTVMSLTPRCSWERSKIGPILSVAQESWVKKFCPMPVKVSRFCFSRSCR